jgi:hypothetical protein
MTSAQQDVLESTIDRQRMDLHFEVVWSKEGRGKPDGRSLVETLPLPVEQYMHADPQRAREKEATGFEHCF